MLARLFKPRWRGYLYMRYRKGVAWHIGSDYSGGDYDDSWW